MSSRTFVALEQPISLARGSITTKPFNINLRNYYEVKIDTGWEKYFDPNCLVYNNTVRSRWMLYKDGAPFVSWIDSSHDYPTYLGNFFSDHGTYELHLEILSDTACLNPGHPKLLVYTSREEYEDWASPLLWSSGFGLTLGLSLASLALLAWQFNRHDTRISDSPSIGQYFQWAQKLPLRPQMFSLPAFALMAAPGLAILIFAYMVFLAPYPSKGLYVHLLRTDESAVEGEQLGGPVIVHIIDAGAGVTPKVYVNSALTSWNKLEAALRDQLKIRPMWVVHVEADTNLDWGVVVSVMDIAQGLHARVILVTSNRSPGSTYNRKVQRRP
jgi:biopolymer transport protein ExbD